MVVWKMLWPRQRRRLGKCIKFSSHEPPVVQTGGREYCIVLVCFGGKHGNQSTINKQGSSMEEAPVSSAIEYVAVFRCDSRDTTSRDSVWVLFQASPWLRPEYLHCWHPLGDSHHHFQYALVYLCLPGVLTTFFREDDDLLAWILLCSTCLYSLWRKCICLILHEPDTSLLHRYFGWLHQLPDGIEDDLEL